MVFCLVVRGVYPPNTLGGPTTKKKFLCASSLSQDETFTVSRSYGYFMLKFNLIMDVKENALESIFSGSKKIISIQKYYLRKPGARGWPDK